MEGARWLLSVLLVALTLIGCRQRPADVESGPLCGRTGQAMTEQPLSADLAAALDPVIADGMASMAAVGLTLAVQCADSPLFVKGYGEADLDTARPAAAGTVYEIGSISKQFTAAAILKLVEEDRLELDDPVGATLPDLPADWQPISLRQLLSHTGGVPDHYAIFRQDPTTPFDFDRAYRPAELVDAFLALDAHLAAPPGTRFLYSTTDYAMVTAVVEAESGRDYGVYMADTFFGPLGLTDTSYCTTSPPAMATGYTIGPDGPVPAPAIHRSFFSGGGGLCSTAGDLIRWERALTEGQVVSPASYRTMSTSNTEGVAGSVPYGLGLHLGELGGREAVYHEGGTVAFSSWLVYYPETDLVVALLCNTLGPEAARILDLVVAVTDTLLATED